jgi:urease beta subunit
MAMIREHERVALLVDLPAYHLKIGDVGTVVHLYNTNKACEVEFFTADGETFDVITVDAVNVRPVHNREVLHVRPLAA